MGKEEQEKLKLRNSLFERVLLSCLGGGALLTFILSHRGVLYFLKQEFYPFPFNNVPWLFWIVIVVVYGVYLVGSFFVLQAFENLLSKQFHVPSRSLQELGSNSVRFGLILSGLVSLMAAVLIYLDLSLLNVWDILFIMVFVGLYYIGVYLHFYYSVPLSSWEAADAMVELEKLKIEYEEQKMYLKIFLGITVSFLVSQVFVVLKSKFEPYLQDPDKYSYLQPVMILNAFEIGFLIVVIWALVFSQVIRRMEEVKLKLIRLELHKETGRSEDSIDKAKE
jgi:hypothetical protein